MVAIDWSARGIHATVDGETVTQFRWVEDLLDGLTEPHTIVAESPIESWDSYRRVAVLAKIREAGHTLLGFRPVFTSRYRRQREEKKTNEGDAKIIYRIAIERPEWLYPVPMPDPEWARFVETAAREYNRARVDGRKEAFYEEAARALGKYKDLPEEHRTHLGNGEKYITSLLAAAWFAATQVQSRDAFERLLGLSAAGYPNVLRSEIQHHHLKHRRKKILEEAGAEAGEEAWQKWRSGFRRSLRWAYRQFREELDERATTGENLETADPRPHERDRDRDDGRDDG